MGAAFALSANNLEGRRKPPVSLHSYKKKGISYNCLLFLFTIITFMVLLQ